MDDFTDRVRDLFGENEPIFTDELIEVFSDASKMTVFNWLNGALDDGRLRRYSRGVYYIPESSLVGLGSVPLSSLKVIKKKYLSDGGMVYGYVSGLNLENEAGISPQVPATLEITTNRASKRVRKIEPFGGWRSITLRTPRVEVNRDNVDVLRFLDLITDASLQSLSNLEKRNMRAFFEGIDGNMIVSTLRYYPAKTAKRLLESEYRNVLAQ
jgi:hypothetical protein